MTPGNRSGISTDIQVVILAGGLGTRLGELTRNLPKSLIVVGDKPFLQYQIELLKKQGVTEIVLCIGHLGDAIERYFGDGSRFGVTLRYSREKQLLGTAGAIKNAEPLLADLFFTLYGDSYLSLDYRSIERYFRCRQKLALMTVYRNYDQYDKSNTEVQGDLVLKYSKVQKTPGMVYIDYGANLFQKKVLQFIPENQFYSLEGVFSALIERQELLAYEVEERFYEIGSSQGVREFIDFMERGK